MIITPGKYYGAEIRSDGAAQSLAKDVREIMNDRYDIELPEPELYGLPDRTNDFMVSFPPHSPVEFTLMSDLRSLKDIFEPVNKAESGEKSVILYNHPERTMRTRDSATYGAAFAHELGHCALFAHPQLASGYNPYHEVTKETELHEGIATLFEGEFWKYLLEGKNGSRFAIEGIAKWSAKTIDAVCAVLPAGSFGKRSARRVAHITRTESLSMADVLRDPARVLEAMKKPR